MQEAAKYHHSNGIESYPHPSTAYFIHLTILNEHLQ